MILQHRERFWNLLDINLMATRRLNSRNGIYFNRRARTRASSRRLTAGVRAGRRAQQSGRGLGRDQRRWLAL